MKTLRLGEISFINALPLRFAATALAGIEVEKAVLPPTGLNQAMLAEKLDVSPVSSAFYLRHRERFTLLDGISISAEHPVESVLLFLPHGFEVFHPETVVAVPDSSETSVALMQYAIFRHTGLKLKDTLPIYPVEGGAALIEQGIPLLAIGDEALTLKTRFPKDQVYYIDLAEFWQSETGLPFVFAVWIAQSAWADAHPEVLMLLNRLFVQQKQAFQENPELQQQIIQEAHGRCPHLPLSLLMRYFTGALSYNLDQSHQMALSRFADILEWLDNDHEQPTHRHHPELPIQLLHR